METFIYKKFAIKELASLYDKNPRSFQTWLRPIQEKIGPKLGWDYTPHQVKIIVKYLGPPPGYNLPD